MAAKKKRSAKAAKRAPKRETSAPGAAGKASRRLRRSDAEKLQIVQQVLASGNQSAEIKRLGIYPNQFYDWKKKYTNGGDHAAVAASGRGRRGRPPEHSARSAADEARAFIHGKSALLERLRTQREQLDVLIKQMEA
ncbi:MAG: Transposase [Myxococcaceae bacterium]|nr:Transposase [Myxococcaceae bacterium]